MKIKDLVNKVIKNESTEVDIHPEKIYREFSIYIRNKELDKKMKDILKAYRLTNKTEYYCTASNIYYLCEMPILIEHIDENREHFNHVWFGKGHYEQLIYTVIREIINNVRLKEKINLYSYTEFKEKDFKDELKIKFIDLDNDMSLYDNLFTSDDNDERTHEIFNIRDIFTINSIFYNIDDVLYKGKKYKIGEYNIEEQSEYFIVKDSDKYNPKKFIRLNQENFKKVFFPYNIEY